MSSEKIRVSRGSSLALYVAKITIATIAVSTGDSANGKTIMLPPMEVNASPPPKRV